MERLFCRFVGRWRSITHEEEIGKVEEPTTEEVEKVIKKSRNGNVPRR